jgi:hypothetical protein
MFNQLMVTIKLAWRDFTSTAAVALLVLREDILL